jgi:hypothetical protein
MNRLNHCAPIFEEGYRSGDAHLLQTAVLWCENFYDQSIWWGPGETGGTRYNNVVAMGQKPPDNDQTYMWRSTNSVSFCTKGYDAFFYAWEETGDPRMKQALEAISSDFIILQANQAISRKRNVCSAIYEHSFLPATCSPKAAIPSARLLPSLSMIRPGTKILLPSRTLSATRWPGCRN